MRLGAPLPSRGPAYDPDVREVWRVIDRAQDFAVSNLGRVKRVVATTHQARVCVGKVRTLTVNRAGYHVTNLRIGGRDKTFLVHRLVCIAFHGPPPSGDHQAAHGNGQKTDNRADNLRWATALENASDKEAHGTVRRGEAHQYSKLTDAAVAEIRNAPWGQGKRLSVKFGIERTHVSRLRNRKARHWSHVPFPTGSEQ